MAPYVFVPGGGWGGFVWHLVASLLRAAGHEVFTPTLTGLGERVHLARTAILAEAKEVACQYASDQKKRCTRERYSD